MDSCIFFPHFYLTNDTVLRHQYLYLPSLCRIHTSDRPPRDSKELKRFLSEMAQYGFLENWIPEAADSETVRRFLRVIEHGFCDGIPEYIRQLGKYEKERTSAKTFHLGRVDQWPEVARRLVELGIAKIDRYNEWCFSTRKMVMTLTTCLALRQQTVRQAPRCTDNPEHDELAMLIECLPPGGDAGRPVWRAVLEFPYAIPQNLGDLSLDRLQNLREEIAPFTRFYWDSLPDLAGGIGRADSSAALEEAFRAVAGRVQESLETIQDRLKVFNIISTRGYGQYRWFIPPDSAFESVPLEEAYAAKEVRMTLAPRRCAPEDLDGLTRYPGCYVWSLSAPRHREGIWGQAVSSWLKRFWPVQS